MKALKRFIIFLLIVGVFFGIAYKFRAQIIKVLSYSECDTPIAYRLGSLDPKFGLNKESVIATIQNAADIWSKTYGKTLFINSPKALLTVNFVYDERSALNTQIDQMQNQLDQKNSTLKQQINIYEADLATFEQKLSDLNAQIDRVNNSGGATPDQYKKLTSQQKEVNAEGDLLNARARQLNLATNDFNSKVTNLNQSVNQFNETLTQKPEEGLYNGNDKTITIYFANDQKELTHTLAHEFGHALGMQHTSDSKSIMYPNTTSSLSVTAQDKSELDNVCREQLLPMLWLRGFVVWSQTVIGPFVQNYPGK